MGKQETKMGRLLRVLWTVLLWLALAVVAAIVTAFVRDIPQLGLKGTLEAIWDTNLEPPVERRWWANFMDWVILLVSLAVAVRIMYPPKDLEDDPAKDEDASRLQGEVTSAPGPHQI